VQFALTVPTVMDRLIQQMLLQAPTPIFAPAVQRA
jgi:retron-type reverse transcriptase